MNNLTKRENEIVYFALSRLLDDEVGVDEFNEINDLRAKFGV